MSATYANGDRVRVTIEGTVNRVLNFDGTQELRIAADGLDHFIYTDTANVEKVEPEVETFGPGDVVREKSAPRTTRTLFQGGYYNHEIDIFYPWGDEKASVKSIDGFTKDRYERVEVS